MVRKKTHLSKGSRKSYFYLYKSYLNVLLVYKIAEISKEKLVSLI